MVEIINYAKDGSEFWLEMEVVPVKDATRGGARTLSRLSGM